MEKTWKLITRCGGRGHKFYRHVPTDKVAVADNSGSTPDRTDDGILWLDEDYPVRVCQEHAVFAVIKESDGCRYVVMDAVLEGVEVATELGLRVAAEGKMAALLAFLLKTGKKVRVGDAALRVTAAA